MVKEDRTGNILTTMRHTCSPGFDPAFFHAVSFSADDSKKNIRIVLIRQTERKVRKPIG